METKSIKYTDLREAGNARRAVESRGELSRVARFAAHARYFFRRMYIC